MTRPHASVAVALAAALCAFAAAGPSAQRSAARERSLYVSVVDQNGAPVADLGPTDVIVKEDNVTREVLRIAPASDPMQVAVLVDTSVAARDSIPHMRQALPAFVNELAIPTATGRKNEVAIIGIGDRPTILAEYSTDPAQVRKGIDRIWALPNSGMYLLDALVETAQGVKKRESARPVIVSIATAGQDFSNTQHDQVIDALKAGNIAYYALSLGQPDSSLEHEARERAMVLDEGPRTTGGYQQQLLTSMALTPKLKELATQLTHQYKVTYARPESLIPPEKTTVAAAKPGLTARGTPVKEDQVRP
jgi:hypothetical protein